MVLTCLPQSLTAFSQRKRGGRHGGNLFGGGGGTCRVEDSASGANRLNRARFMPGVKARDSRRCPGLLPLRSFREWDGRTSGRQWVVAVQNSNALSRLASTAKTARELQTLRSAPRRASPPPHPNFWPPLSDEARRKTHCPIRASAIQTRGTRRPFPLLSHGEEITRSSTVFYSSQVPTTQHGSTVRRGPVLHPAIASRQNTMTLLGVQAGIVPLGLTLDLS